MQKPAEQSKVWTKPQLQRLGAMKDVALGKVSGVCQNTGGGAGCKS